MPEPDCDLLYDGHQDLRQQTNNADYAHGQQKKLNDANMTGTELLPRLNEQMRAPPAEYRAGEIEPKLVHVLIPFNLPLLLVPEKELREEPKGQGENEATIVNITRLSDSPAGG